MKKILTNFLIYIGAFVVAMFALTAALFIWVILLPIKTLEKIGNGFRKL